MSRRTVLTLGAGDWARCRFVRSVLFETNQAVRALMLPRRQQHQRTWLNTIDRAGARARLPVLGALSPPHGWIPDFLAPPPGSSDRSVDDELSGVAACPPELVAAELRLSMDSWPAPGRKAVLEPLIADPGLALATVVAELRWAWKVLVAPYWAPVSELMTADVAYRSREITRAGLGRALSDLHASVSWDDGAITVDPAADDRTLDLAGRGLALMPSAFAWPDVILVLDSQWPPTLVYPARGIGGLWSAPAPAPAALAGVLGPTRALLLADLAQAATTTSLAARHRLSPATVSAQLGRLRASGLVTGRRIGKEVHYRRTPLAEALIRANSAPFTGSGPVT